MQRDYIKSNIVLLKCNLRSMYMHLDSLYYIYCEGVGLPAAPGRDAPSDVGLIHVFALHK